MTSRGQRVIWSCRQNDNYFHFKAFKMRKRAVLNAVTTQIIVSTSRQLTGHIVSNRPNLIEIDKYRRGSPATIKTSPFTFSPVSV